MFIRVVTDLRTYPAVCRHYHTEKAAEDHCGNVEAVFKDAGMNKQPQRFSSGKGQINTKGPTCPLKGVNSDVAKLASQMPLGGQTEANWGGQCPSL